MSSISGNYNNFMNEQLASSLFGGTSTVGASYFMSELQSGKASASQSSSSSYGQNTASASELLPYVSELKDNSADLLDSLQALKGKQGETGSAFNSGFKATTSDATAVTAANVASTPEAKATSDAAALAKQNGVTTSNDTTYGIQVSQVATTQKNEGQSLAAAGNDFGANKYFEFEVNVGGKSTSVSFATDPNDNNKSAQQKMADAINKKDLAVKATVVYDEKAKTSKLVLESKETGIGDTQDKVFSISDKTGAAVALTGTGSITQEAKNASYKIGIVDKEKSTASEIVFKGDVIGKTSKSNDIRVSENLSATLTKASDKTVTVGLAAGDGKAAINATRDMVNGFNGLYDAAKNELGNSGAAKLYKELSSMSESYKKSLESIGITRGEGGYLKIDEDKMKKAAESGQLQKFFEDDKDSNYGFANKLQSTATKIKESPAQYVTGYDEATTPSKSYEKDPRTTDIRYLDN